MALNYYLISWQGYVNENRNALGPWNKSQTPIFCFIKNSQLFVCVRALIWVVYCAAN